MAEERAFWTRRRYNMLVVAVVVAALSLPIRLVGATENRATPDDDFWYLFWSGVEIGLWVLGGVLALIAIRPAKP